MLSPGGQETVLYSFCSLPNCADGETPGGVVLPPSGGLFRDAAGNLYGTTPLGGAHPDERGYSGGTVFEVTPEGNETVLYSFCTAKKCADGATPLGGLVMGAAGNLYGTTFYGGANRSPREPHRTPNLAGEVIPNRARRHRDGSP